jgi:hypothetical protein
MPLSGIVLKLTSPAEAFTGTAETIPTTAIAEELIMAEILLLLLVSAGPTETIPEDVTVIWLTVPATASVVLPEEAACTVPGWPAIRGLIWVVPAIAATSIEDCALAGPATIVPAAEWAAMRATVPWVLVRVLP